MLTEKELLVKKKEIGEAKSRISELTGQENLLLAQLKDDWGVSTLAQAKKKIELFKKNVAQLDEQIETMTEQLEETYFSEEDDDE